jgi:hypothetical protein
MMNTHAAGPPLTETTFFHKLLVKFPFGRKLEHEEDTFTIVEITI